MNHDDCRVSWQPPHAPLTAWIAPRAHDQAVVGLLSPSAQSSF